MSSQKISCSPAEGAEGFFQSLCQMPLLRFPKLRKILASEKTLYALVLMILIVETTAMSFLKEYSLSGHWISLAAGLGCYFIVNLLLIESLRYEGMGIVNMLWSAFSVVFVVTIGVILFGEKVSMLEVTGIAFVIAGTVVLRSSNHAKIERPKRGGRCLHIAMSSAPPRP